MISILLFLLGSLTGSRPDRREATWYRHDYSGHGPPPPGPGPDPAGPGAARSATVPPGMAPPGAAPPGMAPPGAAPPGMASPGMASLGTVPPGTVPPGTVPPGTVAPGTDWPAYGPVRPGRTRRLPSWPPQPAGRRRPPGGYGRFGRGGPRRHLPRWAGRATLLVVVVLIFRRAIASIVLFALSAAFHLIGVNIHLPHVRFGWPWQTISAASTTNTDLGPWVLQKIEGISRPALGQANFNFLFTRKVSKSMGFLPCWYSSTFNAVGHASATVNLNPGPAWWASGSGHYALRVTSRPHGGQPGHVTVMMVLPRPQLPQSVHDVTIDDIPSKPVDTQHSWTYPGLACGLVLRPQFAESVLYAQAQQIAFDKATRSPQVTGALIRTAEAEAAQTIRNNFIQPTVNALGYTLDRLTIRWAAGSP